MIALDDGVRKGSKSRWLGIVKSRRIVNAIFVAVLVVSLIALGTTKPSEIEDPGYTDMEISADAQEKARRLDHQHLSRMTLMGTEQSVGAPRQQKLEKSSVSKYTETIVVGRLANETERTQWLYDKVPSIEDRQIYIVDDNTTVENHHLDRNHGREAAVYLDYIIRHYDELSDITFFWHNDEIIWHNNLLLAWDSVRTLNRMNRDKVIREGYVPSRCDHWPGCPNWIRFDPSPAEHRLDPHRLEEMFTPELFTHLFPDTKKFPPYFAGTCCSQFAVSRDAIRRRPKLVYEKLAQWVLEYEYDQRSGMVFEYVWPFLFTGKGTDCPSMSHCYCDTYNICLEDMEDIDQLVTWNDMRSRREEIKWQVAFMEEARESRQSDAETEGASEEEILSIEEHFGPPIDRLNQMMERLINDTWQAREDIIHKYRLPAPPVGW